MTTNRLQTIHRRLAAVGLALALIGAPTAMAATTDISQVPLTTSSSTGVKPNLMFILDDSGSMARGYMPDDANFAGYKYGYFASQCNGLAYNPSTTYTVPVNSAGANLTPGSFSIPSPSSLSNQRGMTTTLPAIGTGSKTFNLTSGNNGSYAVDNVVTVFDSSDVTKLMVGRVTAWNGSTRVLTIDVYATKGSGTLSTPLVGDGDNRAYYYRYTGAKTKLDYVYTSSGLDTTATDAGGNASFYAECNANVGSSTGSSVFSLVEVTAAMSDFQNYANWYTYYNTRIKMMRSSAKLAFKDIGDRYRVGFTTISSRYVAGSNFLDIADFGSTQKGNFYTYLDNASPGNSTPLRGSLAKVGQYYAKQAIKDSNGTAQDVDPLQYSCQRNYALLTTDGYWNTGDERTSAPKYGPQQLDRTTNVGQQDGGSTPRPMKDSEVSTTRMRSSDLQARSVTAQWTQLTQNLQSRSVTTTYTQSSSQLQSRTISPSYTVATSTLQRQTLQLQISTTGNGNSGNPTWTSWANTTSCQWDNNGNNRTRCQYVPGATTNATSSCTASYGTNSSSGVTWSGPGTNCSYSAPVNTTAASCTAVAASAGPTYTVLSAVSCTNTSTYGAWTNVSSCTAGPTVGCQYAAPTTSTVSTCTAVAASPSSPYTVGVAVSCSAPNSVYGAWANASNCTTSSTNQCQYSTGTSATVGACTAIAASPGSPYTVPTAVTCTSTTPIYGAWGNVASCTTSTTSECQYTAWSAYTNVGTCTAVARSAASPYTVGQAVDCNTTTTGGASDTLADVAMYYYNTDLRTSSNCSVTFTDSNGNTVTNNVCTNNLTAAGEDTATHQHMTTFTMGLGVSGTLRYTSNYKTANSGDFYDIRQGTKDWPDPTADRATAVDDLWHAAVNGRGTYFSAGDPTALAAGLAETLNSIRATIGFGSAAAASTLQPVYGDNSLYLAKYKSVFWIGDLVSYSINTTTGALTGPNWSASTQLAAKISAGTPRNIYYFRRTAGQNTGALRDFSYANLTADSLNSLFDNACSKSTPLTQCSVGGYNVSSINSGSNMVTYLRGGAGSTSTYRVRTSNDSDIPGGELGDIIGGAPVYVGKAPFLYTENNYATFAAAKASRAGTVYVGANDGMLHAFDSSTGDERWAYIPSMVMSNMYKLADTGWDARHQYFVNGAPVVGDVYDSVAGAWKSILVGGLGAGGRGYYALDITDPTAPRALWEFNNDSLGGNSNLGLTFGNPIITKRASGQWVVVFTSGYNNTSGDGNGHLFVVDAVTGQRLVDMPTYTAGTTPAGSASTPSGLSKINAWVASESDNTARRFYGGDLLGNLWRFDIDNLVAPNGAALRLATMQVGSTPQPITTRPLLAEVRYGSTWYPVVSVGTGRYLGISDVSNTDQQTVYALKDPLTNTSLGNVYTSTNVVQHSMTDVSPTQRTIAASTVDWSTKDGWRINFLTSGERMNVDSVLVLGSLFFAGNIPTSNACTPGGSAYVYNLSLADGSSTLDPIKVDDQLVGLNVVYVGKTATSSGTPHRYGVSATQGLKPLGTGGGVMAPSPSGRRTSWRELVN